MLQQISIDNLPDSFVVFDLETTGLDAAQHEIIEIAAIRFKKGREKSRLFYTQNNKLHLIEQTRILNVQ